MDERPRLGRLDTLFTAKHGERRATIPLDGYFVAAHPVHTVDGGQARDVDRFLLWTGGCRRRGSVCPLPFFH
jgi:hypothetical protein